MTSGSLQFAISIPQFVPDGAFDPAGFRMFSAFGLDGQHVVSRFTEGLELMRAMWTQDRVDFGGRFWQARGAAMEPKPF